MIEYVGISPIISIPTHTHTPPSTLLGQFGTLAASFSHIDVFPIVFFFIQYSHHFFSQFNIDFILMKFTNSWQFFFLLGIRANSIDADEEFGYNSSFSSKLPPHNNKAPDPMQYSLIMHRNGTTEKCGETEWKWIVNQLYSSCEWKSNDLQWCGEFLLASNSILPVRADSLINCSKASIMKLPFKLYAI